MKKILLGTMLASMLISNSLIQATAHEALETRKSSMELNGITVEFEENLHECEQGYSLWYSVEHLKEAELGGYECFIPVEESNALDSSVVFMLVVEDDENTVVGLEETLASYESSGEPYYNLEVGEIETTTLENGLVLDTAQVIYNDTADYFYLLKDESADNVLYITATMPADEQNTYAVWFDRMVETIEFTDETLSSVDFSQALPQCSLCEEYKECGEYTVDGQTYLVCDNDYAEFAYAFGLNEEAVATQVCSLCEVAKPCGEYTVDGQTYLVCDDDYAEFAYAFGLNDTAASQVCSLCEVEKPCGEYTVDGQTYLVCDDDYAEFAHAFGLE